MQGNQPGGSLTAAQASTGTPYWTCPACGGTLTDDPRDPSCCPVNGQH